jgi:hypothetical protein
MRQQQRLLQLLLLAVHQIKMIKLKINLIRTQVALTRVVQTMKILHHPVRLVHLTHRPQLHLTKMTKLVNLKIKNQK